MPSLSVYKIDRSSTVNSTNVTFKSAAIVAAACLSPLVMDVGLTKDLNESNTYQVPILKHINLPAQIQPVASSLSPIPEKLINLKDHITQFVKKPKVEDIYLASLHKSVNDSLSFLNHFPHELPLPTAYNAEDGEIVLEWFFNNKSVVLSITGDGYYGYAMLRNGKYIAGQGDGDINDVITPELYEYLQS